MDVPEGYFGLEKLAALKVGAVQTGVSTWAVGTVYADPCTWRGTLPNFGRCDLAQFRVWLDTGGEERLIEPGQIDLLWTLDVDGVPLMIDASMQGVASAKVRAELVQIVESLHIDPR